MAQETVTEFRTVEEQKTRTLCDNCNRTEEEAEILTVAINPKEKVRESQELELIKTFDDQFEAEHFMHDNKKPPSTQVMGEEEVWGVGWNHNTKTVDIRASATADLCASCVFDLFDIKIPEEEETEDINLGDGELNINTTKEVTTIWPQIPEWNDGTHPIPEMGWKGKILSWPVPLVFSFYELMTGVLTGDEERQKGYVAGSLGAILWTGLILTVLYLTSFIVFAV